MKAMIWAAGLGTRLRPLTESRPKAMVPVADKPMLEHALLRCRDAGIEEVMINTHYFPDTITSYFGDGSKWGMDIHYSHETQLLENAGALVNVKKYFNNEPFLAFASDNLTDIDLKAMMDFHQAKQGVVTIATTQADDVSRYGIVATDGDAQISLFQEKPKQEDALSDQVATCIYMFEPNIFDYLPQTPESCHFGKQVFPVLLDKKVPLFAYRHTGYWNDVGNPGNYLLSNFDPLYGRFKANLDGFEALSARVWVGEGVYIHPTAKIIGPVIIGAHTHIGEGAIVGPDVVIGAHSTIENGAEVERSLFWEHCDIGEGALVWQSILAEHCKVYPHNQLKNVVLGNHSLINFTMNNS